MARFLALLRAVNVGGRKLPMADLRALCARLGWEDVQTYIQSGNLVFTASGSAAAHETALEKAIASKFGLEVPVMVRTGAAWKTLLLTNPFSAEARDMPQQVALGLSKAKLKPGAAAAIEARGADGERVAEAGGALWFHYPHGLGRSKITPALIDRAAGSPVTARNWRTAEALAALLG